MSPIAGLDWFKNGPNTACHVSSPTKLVNLPLLYSCLMKLSSSMTSPSKLDPASTNVGRDPVVRPFNLCNVVVGGSAKNFKRTDCPGCSAPELEKTSSVRDEWLSSTCLERRNPFVKNPRAMNCNMAIERNSIVYSTDASRSLLNLTWFLVARLDRLLDISLLWTSSASGGWSVIVDIVIRL
ncbi:hypothetical protein WICPIJ_006602 [Wickerhamomyces pijperi]|uniref:Uncharacterized protein n=1 Tax=Wickerhamomyces pijperi TaxID=599730 RepID=A0A9P8TL83_WICPI|nr:hypothetical protein WICPIJ_006602 [Wickerhamomyces pijperi]